MKTIDHIWLSSLRGSIGIVLAENDFYQMAYICSVDGNDLETDIKTIKSYGAKLSYKQASGFFNKKINPIKYK